MVEKANENRLLEYFGSLRACERQTRQKSTLVQPQEEREIHTSLAG